MGRVRKILAQRRNDEVDAYLITYIYDKITSIFYKHDRLIKS